MSDAGLVIEGFDTVDWRRLASLFLHSHPTVPTDPPAATTRARRNTIYLFTSEVGRPVFAIASGRGVLPPQEVAELDAGDLAATATAQCVDRIVALAPGALRAFAAHVQARVPASHDVPAQWLALGEALRDVAREGKLRVWPEPTGGAAPIPPVVIPSLDMVLPRERTLLVAAWDGSDVAAAVALRRGAVGLERLVGPDSILSWSGPLSGELPRDHRTMERAVSAMLGPVHLGIFAQSRTLADLVRRPEPGAWARAIALREVLVRPAPPFVHAGVFVDAARAAAQWAGKRLATLELDRYADPLVQAGREGWSRAGQAVAGAVRDDRIGALLRLLRGPKAP
jgi:hypothetical protein